MAHLRIQQPPQESMQKRMGFSPPLAPVYCRPPSQVSIEDQIAILHSCTYRLATAESKRKKPRRRSLWAWLFSSTWDESPAERIARVECDVAKNRRDGASAMRGKTVGRISLVEPVWNLLLLLKGE